MIWLQRQGDYEAGAIINFYKPIGRSSFWVVKKVRQLVGTKVGHAGTLDPFAEGVLLLCTGKATRQVQRLMELDKEYLGEIELGVETDTEDVTGEVIGRQPVPPLDAGELNRICQEFVGDIYQVPPMFSAKKLQGQRLYKLARAGKVVPREPRLVHVYRIELLAFRPPVAQVKIQCSKGTYIRALARDIGQRIGCGAYLKSLVRTRIGEFDIADSVTLDEFEKKIRSL